MSEGAAEHRVRGDAGTAVDRAALVSRLYGEHGARLYRYALMILADAGDAEDAIQQVFAAILADTRVVPEQPAGYLRTAVRNAAYSMLRHRRVVRDTAPLLLRPASPDCTPAERVALEQGLARLPPEQREIVHLHVYEGMTFKEAAETTGASINTVAARYRYALQTLRRHIR